MKLKNIRQNSDKIFTTYIFRLMELIKQKANLAKNARIFYLDIFNENYYFCYKNLVFVTSCYLNQEIRDENYNINKLKLTNLYSFELLKEYPKKNDNVVFKELIKDEKYSYSTEQFLEWIDSPNQLTISVDIPYYMIIRFLKDYKQEYFKTDRYIFYTKRDEEYCWILHLYAKEIKTNKEILLYLPPKSKYNKIFGWSDVVPSTLKDFIAVGKNNDVSKYQLTQVKKEFLKFTQDWCQKLHCNNYFALELIKQTIQPIEQLHEWGIHRIFSGRDKNNQPKKFTNIWIEDHPNYPDEPFFFLTNNPITWKSTRVVAINFKSATYHSQFDTKYNIYKQGDVKYKNFILDEQYIKELMEFLSTPIELKDYEKTKYGNKVKTNWQKMIFEYNHNTCGWGWGDDGYNEPLSEYYDGIKTIPFDLVMPDYTKLLDKSITQYPLDIVNKKDNNTKTLFNTNSNWTVTLFKKYDEKVKKTKGKNNEIK